jgi:hypothetical protein
MPAQIPEPAVWQALSPFHPSHWRPATAGPILAALRRAAGLSQADMAQRVGCSRHAIGKWRTIPAPSTAPEAFPRKSWLSWRRPVSTWSLRPHPCARVMVPYRRRGAADAGLFDLRAKTRKGHPCRAKPEPGRRRCRFHGGRSTGPKTAEGRTRIAEAQRARWAAFRACRNSEGTTAGAAGQSLPS